MKKFDTLVEKYYNVVLEADAPPMDASAPPMDAAGGGAPPMDAAGGGAPPMPGGDMGGDMGGEQGDMDNESKRDADPREYTRSILSLLVDKKEGVTPEMFDDFMDSVSLAVTKIKDKEGIKHFYGNFYKKLQIVLDLRDELKSMFKQMAGTLDDLVGATDEPDDAGGGEGMSGPSGPGVG